MQLSIVTTLYKSAPYIDEFYQRITAEAEKITQDYEVIFVDDGSPDNSLEKAVALHQQDSKVTVIELSRNFGHHKAIMTGLAHAKGDYVFLIDSDLEEEPELLGRFWQELHQDKNVDVVYGVQETRKGGWFEKITGYLFWMLMDKFSTVNIQKNIVTARLMSGKFNSALIKYKETELFIAGVWADAGYNQKKIIIRKHSKSKSTYTFKNKISIAVTSVTSFSGKPLIYIFNLGLIVTLFSVFFIAKILYEKIFFGVVIEGWTSLIVSVWFFGGLIILFLGVIGIYISKIFIEVKKRPLTIIKNIYENINE